MSSKPRAMTPAEMREVIIGHLNMLVRYWARMTVTDEISVEDDRLYRLRGMLHSVLVMFDGGSSGIPALNITPSPCPEDIEFHGENGVNWWSPTIVNDVPLLPYALTREG